MAKHRFQLILLKPSHYHDDGYVIRWWRALIPSNSLASVYGLALDCAQRRVLGPDVEIDIEVIDETNTRVNVPRLIRRFRRHDNFGLLALVGVQSNQYPRALDIARPFRAAGIAVKTVADTLAGDSQLVKVLLCCFSPASAALHEEARRAYERIASRE